MSEVSDNVDLSIYFRQDFSTLFAPTSIFEFDYNKETKTVDVQDPEIYNLIERVSVLCGHHPQGTIIIVRFIFHPSFGLKGYISSIDDVIVNNPITITIEPQLASEQLIKRIIHIVLPNL